MIQTTIMITAATMVTISLVMLNELASCQIVEVITR